ncbi:MAG: superoxide dismutase [Sphingomonadales bacterium]|nr:superoxide dismutase [Sphingomonadales bacterium]
MPFRLPDLPYAKDAFGDTISAETFTYHHDKHHKAYVEKANALVAESGYTDLRLSQVIRKAKESGNQPLFANAAQIWNHSFYWQCLSPEQQVPEGRLKSLIAESFGSHDALLAVLEKEAVGHFASGWAWLVLEGGRLKVTSLHDADTPVLHENLKPLLTIDVWEHAYYVDYRNDRAAHVKAVLANAINWEFVARNLDGDGVMRANQGA